MPAPAGFLSHTHARAREIQSCVAIGELREITKLVSPIEVSFLIWSLTSRGNEIRKLVPPIEVSFIIWRLKGGEPTSRGNECCSELPEGETCG